jgi:hypothetical protein
MARLVVRTISSRAVLVNTSFNVFGLLRCGGVLASPDIQHERRQGAAAAHTELVINVVQMFAHPPRRQVQLLSNDRVRQAGCHQVDDLRLPLAQPEGL